jgi:hypothetical protein
MDVQYTKLPQNRPKGHKICQYLTVQDPPKFTRIGIFGFENLPSGKPDVVDAGIMKLEVTFFVRFDLCI